jgi:murein L,D-transpeptidase YafK
MVIFRKFITRFYFLIAILIIISSKPILANNIPCQVDYIVVEKSKRTLSLYCNNQIIKQYKIALGFNPSGNKQQEGDGRTPEGKYTIVSKNPDSIAHLSLKISYPSIDDIQLAKFKYLTPGSNIMIHGLKNNWAWIGKYHTLVDWTRGCIAVNNDEIEEIYAATPIGTTIEILS